MQMYIGIGLIVAGILLAVVGFSGVIPNIGGSGIGLVLAGGLILGLSFVARPDDEGVEEMPLHSRLINIFISPGEVFRNIRQSSYFSWCFGIDRVDLGGIYVCVYGAFNTGANYKPYD